MLRAIREIQPTWVVGENVFGIVNWDGGLVFNQVQADLEAEGYEVQPYVLPACGVNAPHRRDRVWFVAYRNNTGGGFGLRDNGFRETEDKGRAGFTQPKYCQNGENWATPDTDINGCDGFNCQHEIDTNKAGEYALDDIEQGIVADTMCHRQSGQEYRQKESRFVTKEGSINDWSNFPTQSPVCSRNDGVSAGLAGITFPKWRNESIKAMGNAIVPQVAYQIFKAINEFEKLNK